MANWKSCMAAGVFVLAANGTGAAQTSQPQPELIRTRQQISTMAAVIDQAIKHGVERMMTQFSNLMPDRPRLSGPPRINGVRIEGYGVLFNVQVPGIRLPIMWDLFVQDLQARDTRTALTLLQQFRTMASGMPPGPERTQVERNIIQLQQDIDLGNMRAVPGGRGAVNAASLVPVGGDNSASPKSDARPTQTDPSVVDDPLGAYTREVKASLIESMLESTQPFNLKPDEWFTIIARGGQSTDPLTPGDAIDSSTWIMRVKGSVLAAYHSRSITLEEARKQVEVLEQ